jgi:hypothetical protein
VRVKILLEKLVYPRWVNDAQFATYLPENQHFMFFLSFRIELIFRRLAVVNCDCCMTIRREFGGCGDWIEICLYPPKINRI